MNLTSNIYLNSTPIEDNSLSLETRTVLAAQAGMSFALQTPLYSDTYMLTNPPRGDATRLNHVECPSFPWKFSCSYYLTLCASPHFVITLGAKRDQRTDNF